MSLSGGEVSVAIVNYGVGNLLSIYTGLERVGAKPKIVDEIGEAEELDAVVFPGVGAFKPAMGKLEKSKELTSRMLEEKPVLGICLGMQLLYERSEEGCEPGEYLRGFRAFHGTVRRITGPVKVPQMGWNTIRVVKPECPILEGIPNGAYVYYANSYAAAPSDETCATTFYGIEFSAVSWRENVFGTQFHPEKSGIWGLRVLRNFVECAWRWCRR